jgi:hypothetical protein
MWEGRGCESKKNFFVWRKLKIETKMRKGKYVSKIKPVISNNKFMFVINNPKGTHL